MNKIVFHIGIAFLFILLKCSDNTLEKNNSDCSGKKYVKRVNNQAGTIVYDEEQKKYAVSTSIPGTYDSVDLGFICKVPDSLKSNGLKIIFDGSFYEYDQEMKSPWAGVTYYYLSLDKVTELRNK